LISTDTEQRLTAKLEWAERHIYNLQDAWDLFCKDGYRVASNDDPQTGDRTYYLADVRPIESRFPLIIGDAVHSLRSALDHLAYHLMSISPGITAETLGHVYFPIAENPEKYKTAKRRIEGMRQDAIKAIDAIEPYGGGAGEILWHLHSLDIIDKHKLLIAIGSTNSRQSMAPSRIAATKSNFLGIKLDTYTPAQDAILFRTEPTQIIFQLKTGDKLAVIPKSEVNEHMNFTFEIAFGEPEIVKGHPVIETLHHMAEIIRDIIKRFIYNEWT
jgi:hypothetical protein